MSLENGQEKFIIIITLMWYIKAKANDFRENYE